LDEAGLESRDVWLQQAAVIAPPVTFEPEFIAFEPEFISQVRALAAGSHHRAHSSREEHTR